MTVYDTRGKSPGFAPDNTKGSLEVPLVGVKTEDPFVKGEAEDFQGDEGG